MVAPACAGSMRSLCSSSGSVAPATIEMNTIARSDLRRKQAPIGPASAAHAADGPRLAGAWGSLGLRHPLAPVKPAWRHSGRTLVGPALFSTWGAARR